MVQWTCMHHQWSTMHHHGESLLGSRQLSTALRAWRWLARVTPALVGETGHRGLLRLGGWVAVALRLEGDRVRLAAQLTIGPSQCRTRDGEHIDWGRTRWRVLVTTEMFQRSALDVSRLLHDGYLCSTNLKDGGFLLLISIFSSISTSNGLHEMESFCLLSMDEWETERFEINSLPNAVKRSTYEEDEMGLPCDSQLDSVNNFFSHPFGNDKCGHKYDNGSRYKPIDWMIEAVISTQRSLPTTHIPNTVYQEELGKESWLLRIVDQSKDNGVREPRPGEQAQGNQQITKWALVDVEHFTRVKGL